MERILLFFFGVQITHALALARPVVSLASVAYQSARNVVQIQDSPGKGLGAFCLAPIRSGAWVGEYKGELLTTLQVQVRYWNLGKRQVADRRWIKSRQKRHQGRSGDYLFEMGDELYLDGEDTDMSSWCRFMNHAAEESPTCNVETRFSRQTCEGETVVPPRLWFVALRDIAVGEEMLYDYGDSYWD
jgi:SET domain-containing protein